MCNRTVCVCVCQVSDPNTLILEYRTTHATLRQSRINVQNFLSVLTRVSITGLDQKDGPGSDLIFHWSDIWIICAISQIFNIKLTVQQYRYSFNSGLSLACLLWKWLSHIITRQSCFYDRALWLGNGHSASVTKSSYNKAVMLPWQCLVTRARPASVILVARLEALQTSHFHAISCPGI